MDGASHLPDRQAHTNSLAQLQWDREGEMEQKDKGNKKMGRERQRDRCVLWTIMRDE